MTRIPCIIFLALTASAVAAFGQAADTPPPDAAATASRRQELQEAAEKLKKAKESIDMDKAKAAAAGVLDKLPSKVGDTAREVLESPQSRAKMLDAAKSAAGALLPEAQRALRGTTQQDPVATPPPAVMTPTPGTVQESPPAGGPVPQPLAPLTDGAPVMGKNSVVIEADDSTFDLKNAIFIYSGHVRARHPQFNIQCEELEVHMVKEDEMPAKEAPKPKPKDPLDPEGKEERDNRIKMAVARGPMVIIEKLTETGEVQQGKCKRAVYTGSTGDIVMSQYPQVQRGNVLHIATDPSTEMTFDSKGKLHTSGGRQRTIVLQADSAPGAAPAVGLPTRNSKDQ